jgi:serine/threonine protein phosphatase PrpC
MSTDHKPKNRKEKARIVKAGHRVTPGEGRIDGNLNLSRAIGDLVYKKNPKLSLE